VRELIGRARKVILDRCAAYKEDPAATTVGP